MNRRYFIKILGILSIIPFIPKLPEPYVIKPDPYPSGGKWLSVANLETDPNASNIGDMATVKTKYDYTYLFKFDGKDWIRVA